MLQKIKLLYQGQVTSPAQAMFHLLLHCCSKDGECDGKELRNACTIMIKLYGVNSDWLSSNIAAYRRYAPCITDDGPYLRFLLHFINPSIPVVLLWYCAQIAASDDSISYSEEVLFDKLSSLLGVSLETGRALLHLALQLARSNKLAAQPPNLFINE